jgi:hypothetical protein
MLPTTRNYFLFTLTVWLLVAGALGSAYSQNICGKQAPPCIDQPYVGKTTISGKWPLATDSEQIAVQILLDGKPIDLVQVNSDGTFTLEKSTALGQNSKVEAKQFAPVPAKQPVPDTGLVPVLPVPADTSHNVCGEKAPPCIDQPYVGKTTISGKWPLARDSEQVAVQISLDEKPIDLVKVNSDGTFTSEKLTAFGQNDNVQAKQFAPVSANQPIPDTGLVKVVPAPADISPKICGKADPPCLQQPHEGDTQIQGQFIKKKGVSNQALAVTLNTDPKNPIPADQIKLNSDGTFTAKVSYALSQHNTVNVDQKLGVPAGKRNITFEVPVLPPAPVATTGLCDQTAKICLNQPKENDTKVSGKLATPVPSDAAVGIAINGGKSTSADLNASTGVFTKIVNELSQYDTVQAALIAPPTAKGEDVPSTPDVAVKASMPAEEQSDDASTLFTLGLAGVNVAGSSSSGPTQQAFAAFNVVTPVPFLFGLCPKSKYSLSQKCWAWFEPRIASVPSAANTALSSLNSASALSSENIGQITQSFEIQGGLEYYPVIPWNGRQFGWQNSWSRTSVSLIAGGGMVTPFSASATTTEFQLNPNLAQQLIQSPSLAAEFPQLAAALLCFPPPPAMAPSTCLAKPASNVAFVFPNRSRFYRDWFGGLRLRSFFFSGDCSRPEANNQSCKVSNTFPGTFDIRVGEDETVTAGHLLPVVITLAGSYPLPGTKGILRIFGSTYLRAHSNDNQTTLALVPASPALLLNDPNLIIQQINPSDQDYFRLGVGVDLVSLISKWIKPGSSSTTASSPPASQ